MKFLLDVNVLPTTTDATNNIVNSFIQESQSDNIYNRHVGSFHNYNAQILLFTKLIYSTVIYSTPTYNTLPCNLFSWRTLHGFKY